MLPTGYADLKSLPKWQFPICSRSQTILIPMSRIPCAGRLSKSIPQRSGDRGVGCELSWPKRQHQHEASPVLHERVQSQVSTHAAAEPAAEGKAQSHAGRALRGFVGGLAEGLEQSLRPFGADALTVVAHAEHRELSVRQRFQMDELFARGWRGVLAGVVHEV